MSLRNQAVLGLAAVVVLGFAGTSTMAQDDAKPDKKGTNVQEAAKDAKESAKTKAMQDLELANQLIRYGRQEKNAESLLLAAQILHKTHTSPLNVQHAVTGKSDPAQKAQKMDNSPTALVAQAKRLSSSSQVEALAMATEKLLQEGTRGAAGGPRVDAFSVGPLQSVTWNPITFRAGERAEVFISTGLFSVMILEITDENGNLVVRDNIPANFYRCVWYPRWTGTYRIRLINNDNMFFNCGMATN
jgi:hypothetical protein